MRLVIYMQQYSFPIYYLFDVRFEITNIRMSL